MKRPARDSVLPVALLVSLFLAGCSDRQPAQAGGAPPAAAYTPGIGELMAAQQVRHAKLWFAAEAGNWPLASYEVDELKEGFEDVVKLHRVHGEPPMPIAKLVPEHMDLALDGVTSAVAAHERTRFEGAFDALTAACNACHRATEHGFNVLQRPTSPPFSNQKFEPEK